LSREGDVGRGEDRKRRQWNFADAVVGAIADKQIPELIDGNSIGIVQLGAGSRATVAAKAGSAVAGHSGDDPRKRIDAADALGIRAGNEKASQGIQRDVSDLADTGPGGGTTIPTIGAAPVASHRSNDPGDGVHAADAVVRDVGDKEVPGAVNHRASRSIQLRLGRGASVSAVALGPIASHGVDDPGNGVDAAYPVVRCVPDEEVPRGIDSGAMRKIKACAGGWSTVAEAFATAGNGADDARSRIHAANPGDPCIRYKEVPGTAHS
jgi:hypothetical protein